MMQKRNLWIFALSLLLGATVAYGLQVNGQLIGAILERLAADPTGTGNVEGRVYYNTGTDVAKLYTGAGWVTLADTGAVVANPMDSEGDLMYGGAGGAVTKLDHGTTKYVLQANGVAAPSWVDTLLMGAGSASLPVFSFSADPNTGVWNSAADTVGVTTGGTTRLSVSTTAVTSTLPYVGPAGLAATPTLVGPDSDSGIDLYSGGSVGLIYNGVDAFQAGSAYLFGLDRLLQMDDGSAAAPAYTFSDLDTGMWHEATNTLGFATGGTNRLSLSTTALTSTLPYVAPAGAVGAPTYSFLSDSNTGIYQAAADNITFAVAGAEIAEMDATTFRVQGKIGANSTATSYFHTVLDTFSSANGFGLRIQDTDASGTATNILSQFDFSADDNASGAYLLQFTDSTDVIGGITVAGDASVTYGTTSDARLKKDGREMRDGITRIKRLIPRYFRWRDSGESAEGFYAQELMEVVPDAVAGSPDNDPSVAPLMVDFGKVTPVLVAAVKDLIAQNEALEARLALLEKKDK